MRTKLAGHQWIVHVCTIFGGWLTCKIGFLHVTGTRDESPRKSSDVSPHVAAFATTRVPVFSTCSEVTFGSRYSATLAAVLSHLVSQIWLGWKTPLPVVIPLPSFIVFKCLK